MQKRGDVRFQSNHHRIRTIDQRQGTRHPPSTTHPKPHAVQTRPGRLTLEVEVDGGAAGELRGLAQHLWSSSCGVWFWCGETQAPIQIIGHFLPPTQTIIHQPSRHPPTRKPARRFNRSRKRLLLPTLSMVLGAVLGSTGSGWAATSGFSLAATATAREARTKASLRIMVGVGGWWWWSSVGGWDVWGVGAGVSLGGCPKSGVVLKSIE